MRSCRALFCIIPFLGLSGCLGVSHPFADPGQAARQLTQNNLPPSRLSVPVPVPKNAPWHAATALWAKDVVIALLGQAVPAVSQDPKPGDWWIRLGALKAGDGIRPRYSIVGPDGRVHARGYGAVIDRAGWSAADPEALNTVALQMAPEIAKMLTGIQAQALLDDPHSLMNRAAKIYFAGVHGAPGGGDQELGRAFYTALPDTRNTIQTTPDGADYTVKADVSVKDLPGDAQHHAAAQQLVNIVWHVLTPQGQEVGAATQLHAVAAHSLDNIWGDTAEAAAQEAAGAVRTIVTNYSGRDHKPLPPEMRGSDKDDENAQNTASGASGKGS